MACTHCQPAQSPCFAGSCGSSADPSFPTYLTPLRTNTVEDTGARITGNPGVEPPNAGAPEVPFGEVSSQSDVFQSQIVIHRMSQFLFASKIVLGRLNRCVTKQELNLFKFSPS